MNRVLKMDDRHLAIFTEHRRALVDYAAPIVGCPVRAEDVVQEAYIRFTAAIIGGKVESPVSYLYRIVRNLAIDVTRRASFEHFPEQEALARIPSPAPGIEEALLYRDELRILKAALDELPGRTRDIFIMHRVEGRTLQEIADQFGLSVVRVHQLVRKAMVHAAKHLDAADDDRGEDPPTGPQCDHGKF